MISPVRDWKLIGSLALFGGVFLLMIVSCVYGWHSEYQEYRLRKSGVEKQAAVIDSEVRSRRAPARLRYQFQHENRDYVNTSFVSSSAQRRHPIGTAILVRYLANSPEVNRPVGLEAPVFRAVSRLGLVLMSGVVITVSCSVIWALHKGKRILKPGAFWTKPKPRRSIAQT
jgi:Protein of unknown function (DUF3592)